MTNTTIMPAAVSADPKQFLEYYTKVVFSGDLNKMMQVAKQSQEAEAVEERAIDMARISTPTPHMFDRKTGAVLADNANWLANFNPENARCAVPIASTLFSVIDVFGQLLSGKIDHVISDHIEAFFLYARQRGILKEQLSSESAKVLGQIYRNGSAHSFFPSGQHIRLDLNDSTDDLLQPDVAKQEVVLNVNLLYNITKNTLVKLSGDTPLLVSMGSILTQWIDKNYKEGQTKKVLDAYFNSLPK